MYAFSDLLYLCYLIVLCSYLAASRCTVYLDDARQETEWEIPFIIWPNVEDRSTWLLQLPSISWRRAFLLALPRFSITKRSAQRLRVSHVFDRGILVSGYLLAGCIYTTKVDSVDAAAL